MDWDLIWVQIRTMPLELGKKLQMSCTGHDRVLLLNKLFHQTKMLCNDLLLSIYLKNYLFCVDSGPV